MSPKCKFLDIGVEDFETLRAGVVVEVIGGTDELLVETLLLLMLVLFINFLTQENFLALEAWGWVS